MIIDFALTNATNRIVLHCDARLQVIMNTVQITSIASSLTTTLRQDQQVYAANQLYVITLDNEVPAGEYRMKMDYNGNYGPASNINGFYKTQYVEDGILKY